jgi:hypothetical protein
MIYVDDLIIILIGSTNLKNVQMNINGEFANIFLHAEENQKP